MKIVLANQFRNESKRLKEWLIYNKQLGIKDFILINDNSTDESLSVINSIKEIKVHVLNSERSNTKYYNSTDTNKYAGDSNLAESMIFNFKKAHEFCLETYGRNTYLGFFDVDEFIFFEKYKNKNLNEILYLGKDFPSICLDSFEVNSDLFEINEKWVTQQTTVGISYENKNESSRKGVVKSFQNLNYSDINVFYKSELHMYGYHIHYGGVEPQNCFYMNSKICGFLHYRKPMYHEEINKVLCTQNFYLVKQISDDAFKNSF